MRGQSPSSQCKIWLILWRNKSKLKSKFVLQKTKNCPEMAMILANGFATFIYKFVCHHFACQKQGCKIFVELAILRHYSSQTAQETTRKYC